MFIGLMLAVVAIALVTGVVVLRRKMRRKKEARTIKREREAYELKQIRDREAVARLREKLREELPHSDPALVVHFIDLDDEGRNTVERLLANSEDPPPPLLYDADLKPVECPEFIGYKFSERLVKPDGREKTVDQITPEKA